MSVKDYKLLRLRFTPGERRIFIGLLVAATSQLYLAAFADGFRISAAAVFYPVLIIALMRDSTKPDTGFVTAICVMAVRVTLDLFSGSSLSQSLMLDYPGGIYYLIYDFLLCLMISDRRSATHRHMCAAFCTADICSNAIILLLSGQRLVLATSSTLTSLILLGIARGCAATALLWLGHFYYQLLQRQEHERRYQRLFIMTAELKNELYFLKKDSEDIEGVMTRAYRLYEQLGDLDVPEEIRSLALSIAREVHEIKKDNLRIIRGIEGEVADVYDQEEMRISDLFQILEDSTRRLLGKQRVNIRLECHYEDNIKIIEHYRLLSVIKNLVTNAVEAIQSASGRGVVRVDEFVRQGHLTLRVTDNGPGISPRAMNNLFKVGYSTKFDPNTGNISRGVGLPAVQFIVEELGGKLHVDSTPEKGAQFTVIVPLDAIQGG